MTEADWLTGTDFAALVRFAADHLSPRRQRLLAVGFCRAAAHLFDYPEMFDALVGIDHYADGMASSGAIERVRQRCRNIAQWSYDEYSAAVDTGMSHGLRAYVRSELAWAMAFAASSPLPLDQVGTRIATTIAQHRTGAALLEPVATTEFDVASTEEIARMLLVVREVAGNPFHPVAFSPEWRTSTAITLAQQMYETREFSAMPILADALQDAGCNSEDMLNHCRNTSVPHVRGCWVVDAVLEKE